MRTRIFLVALVLLRVPVLRGQVNYQLGPGDRIAVYVRDLKEIEIKPAYVQLDGTVEFQYAGVIRAKDLNTSELARQIEQRLEPIVRKPSVSVEVIEYGSQPVSILGAVNKPGDALR